jgi:hypothetical protein
VTLAVSGHEPRRHNLTTNSVPRIARAVLDVVADFRHGIVIDHRAEQEYLFETQFVAGH